MSIQLNKDVVVQLIKNNISLFDVFEKVYLFGSILDRQYSNDIDLLLIYSSFSNKIVASIEIIKEKIEEETDYKLDITALSHIEEKEIRFIERLNNRYLSIK